MSFSIRYGGLNAVYSDNLSAWYILHTKYTSNNYDIFVLDSTGIELNNQQSIGTPIPTNNEGGYFTRFSPDGQLFVTYSPRYGLEFFDFDRANGTLSNPRFYPSNNNIDSSGIFGGIEFSPNGRYLYVAHAWYLDQYDLEAPTLEEGYQRIAILESPDDEFFKPYFSHIQMGPDCRLYVFCLSCRYVHIIHRPNEQGTACMLEQRAIETPTSYFRGTPIYPKYRMKALGDTSSICDHVTATVFNSTSEVASGMDEVQALLYPNPASGATKIVFSAPLTNLNYQLYDGQGCVLRSGKRDWLAQGIALPLDLTALSAGIYHLQLRDGDGRVWERRLVVE